MCPDGGSRMNSRKLLYLPLLESRRKRLLLALVVFAVAVGLVTARPWHSVEHGCLVTVRPGESIQAAIDAARAGDVICLTRGVWSENIVIDKPLTLAGRGAGRTTIEAARALQPVVEVSGRGDEPISVRLQGLSISGDGVGAGVTMGGVAAVEINRCSISGRLYGIEAADSAYLSLTDSTIAGNGQRGIDLIGSARATISGSRISGNRGSGLWLSGSAEAVLFDSDISENHRYGLWLRDRSRVEIKDCSVSENSGYGLRLTGFSVAQVLSSRISRNSDQGISAEDSAAVDLAETSVISNWHGVELRNAARASMVDCTVLKNRWDGIRVQNYARAAISGSVISGNRQGVGIAGQAHAEIVHSLVEKNSRYGVFSGSGGEVTGEGNDFRENGVDLGGNLPGVLRLPVRQPREVVITWPDNRYSSLQEAVDALLPGGTLSIQPGIYTAGLTIGTEVSIYAGDGQVILEGKSDTLPVLSLVDGADMHLSGVTVSGGAEGLLVSAGARAVLTGCTISGNAEGINLSYSASADMVACDVRGNERRGIFVGGAARALVTGCSIANNSGYGIAAADSAQITITDSIVTRSGGGGGVVLWGSAEVIVEGNTVFDNTGFGVAIFQPPCFRESPWLFRGRISGSNNLFGSNRGGDVCPPELEFLSAAEGGELDLRP